MPLQALCYLETATASTGDLRPATKDVQIWKIGRSGQKYAIRAISCVSKCLKLLRRHKARLYKCLKLRRLCSTQFMPIYAR